VGLGKVSIETQQVLTVRWVSENGMLVRKFSLICSDFSAERSPRQCGSWVSLLLVRHKLESREKLPNPGGIVRSWLWDKSRSWSAVRFVIEEGRVVSLLWDRLRVWRWERCAICGGSWVRLLL